MRVRQQEQSIEVATGVGGIFTRAWVVMIVAGICFHEIPAWPEYRLSYWMSLAITWGVGALIRGGGR